MSFVLPFLLSNFIDSLSVFAHIRKSTGTGVLRLRIKANDLKNTEGFMRKSDPFFELSRRIDCAGGASWDNVYRSGVVEDNLSPQWQDAAIELSLLCGGDLNHPILLTVYDHESDGKHKAMGKLETTVNGLVRAAENRSEFTLEGRKDKETGQIIVQKADVARVQGITEGIQNLGVTTSSGSAVARNEADDGQPTFIDYISGGCSLHLCVAIDFTGSNGTSLTDMSSCDAVSITFYKH